MGVAHVTARCWLDDEDGYHIWTAHDCNGRRNTTMLPHPEWSATADGRVEPSVNCFDCGAHYFGTIEPAGRDTRATRTADGGQP